MTSIMTPTVMQWVVGLFVSLVVGNIVSGRFIKDVRRKFGPSPARSKEVPTWLTGIIERLFFTLLVAFGLQEIAGSMIGWIGLKLAVNWNHPDFEGNADARSFAMTALQAGLISMLFSYIGGLICIGAFGLKP
jgi:hypothetical protein